MEDTIQESQSNVRMAVFILFIEKVRGVLRFKLFSSFITVAKFNVLHKTELKTEISGNCVGK